MSAYADRFTWHMAHPGAVVWFNDAGRWRQAGVVWVGRTRCKIKPLEGPRANKVMFRDYDALYIRVPQKEK